MARLIEELGIEDSSAASPYLQRFERGQRRHAYFETSSADFLATALERDVILLGEYHPLPTALDTAGWLIGRRSDARPWCLGLEAIHARDQFHLDAFLRRQIDEEELCRRIHFSEEWGYCRRGLKTLLRKARDGRVEVLGLDIAPRGGAESLELRDEVMAERLVGRLERADRPRLVAVLGEAHLADEHLPSQILSRSPKTLLLRLLHDRPAERARSGWYCESGRDLFVRDMVTAGVRERSLCGVYREWARQERRHDGSDPTTALREMIDALAHSLDMDPRRYRVGEALRLADRYPMAICDKDPEAVERLLRLAGLGERRIRAVSRRCGRGRIHFVDEARLVIMPDDRLETLSVAASEVLTRSLRGCAPVPEREAGRPPLAGMVHAGVTSGLAFRLRDPWPPYQDRLPMLPALGHALVHAFGPHARRDERREMIRRWRICSTRERRDSVRCISAWIGAALARAWSAGTLESKQVAQAAKWRLDGPRQAARCFARLIAWTQ